MERRKTLRMIKTPEISQNQEEEGNTLFFETPEPKRYSTKTLENKSEADSKKFNALKFPLELNESSEFSYQNLIKKTAIILLLSLNVILFVALIYTSTHKHEIELNKFVIKEEICDLKNKITELNLKNEELKRLIVKIEKDEKITTMNKDYALLENGAYIDYENTSQIYRYGLFKRNTGHNANIILTNRNLLGECFAFEGSSGQIVIILGKNVIIDYISVYHPIESDKRSSIKNFEVYGINSLDEKVEDEDNSDAKLLYNETLIGTFEYMGSKSGLQDFKIRSGPYLGIKLKVLSNNGHPKYTAVYKISVFGP